MRNLSVPPLHSDYFAKFGLNYLLLFIQQTRPNVTHNNYGNIRKQTGHKFKFTGMSGNR